MHAGEQSAGQMQSPCHSDTLPCMTSTSQQPAVNFPVSLGRLGLYTARSQSACEVKAHTAAVA